ALAEPVVPPAPTPVVSGTSVPRSELAPPVPPPAAQSMPVRDEQMMELAPAATLPAPVPPAASRGRRHPLVWLNQRFDTGVARLGPLGRWLQGPSGRSFLGWAGILLLASAVAWGLFDWRAAHSTPGPRSGEKTALDQHHLGR